MNERRKEIGMHLLATICDGMSCEMNMNVGAPELTTTSGGGGVTLLMSLTQTIRNEMR